MDLHNIISFVALAPRLVSGMLYVLKVEKAKRAAFVNLVGTVDQMGSAMFAQERLKSHDEVSV